ARATSRIVGYDGSVGEACPGFGVRGGGERVARPRHRTQAVGRDGAAGEFAEPVDAVPDALERAVDFEELVFLRTQLGPQQVAVPDVLRGVGGIVAVGVRRRGDLPCVLGTSLLQAVAE